MVIRRWQPRHLHSRKSPSQVSRSSSSINRQITTNNNRPLRRPLWTRRRITASNAAWPSNRHPLRRNRPLRPLRTVARRQMAPLRTARQPLWPPPRPRRAKRQAKRRLQRSNQVPHCSRPHPGRIHQSSRRPIVGLSSMPCRVLPPPPRPSCLSSARLPRPGPPRHSPPLIMHRSPWPQTSSLSRRHREAGPTNSLRNSSWVVAADLAAHPSTLTRRPTPSHSRLQVIVGRLQIRRIR